MQFVVWQNLGVPIYSRIHDRTLLITYWSDGVRTPIALHYGGLLIQAKTPNNYKRRFYLITFHSYEQCRAYKIREFSQMSHTHVFGQPIKQWMLGQVCTYLSVYLILIPKETMQRYIAKESREPSSRLLSNACRLRWKLRQILLAEDFTLDNTTGMRWKTEFTASSTLKSTS